MTQIAGRFVGCFERFLDVLSLLGENLPRINEYTALFANHARIQNVLSLIYVDLLDFCVLAITFFKRRGRCQVSLLSIHSIANKTHRHQHTLEGPVERS